MANFSVVHFVHFVLAKCAKFVLAQHLIFPPILSFRAADHLFKIASVFFAVTTRNQKIGFAATTQKIEEEDYVFESTGLGGGLLRILVF